MGALSCGRSITFHSQLQQNAFALSEFGDATTRERFALPKPTEQQELMMSAINGDKARFHRDRKEKIARRKRTRELLNASTGPSKKTKSPKPAAVSQ